jgi:hypothetical protein
VTPIPTSVFDHPALYLAVKVGTDEWMTPRQRLASSGWAYQSGCVVKIWYEDVDGDGFGSSSTVRYSCSALAGFALNDLDCDDEMSGINPGVEETCNGLDDNCTGEIDEGADGSCDDGDVCTINSCLDASCASEPVDCEDGNVCTVDSCDPGTGCTYTSEADGSPCGDGAACTIEECQGGSCVFLGAVNCDDGNQCTQDSCNEPDGNCTHATAPLDGAPCSDGDLCTVGESCDEGFCSGTPVNCDDGDLCTIDICDGGSGSCNHLPASCDDGIACTTNGCDSASGCTFTPDHGSCNDGNDCTINFCDSGFGCTSVNQDPGVSCDGGTGLCDGSGTCVPS